jgi:hypothetical protein
MMLREDLIEEGLARNGDCTVVAHASYPDRQPLLHPQIIGSYRFMSLGGRVSRTNLELPGNERKESPGPPKKSEKLMK